jgi:hypothetical protein
MPPTRRRAPARRRTQEVPLWRRTATSSRVRSGGPWWWRRDPDPQLPAFTQLSGRGARQLARNPQAQARLQLQQLEQLQLAMAGVASLVTAGGAGAAAAQVRRRGFRFRRQVQPFGWLAGLLAAGTALHLVHGLFWILVVSVLVPGVMCVAARQQHKDKRPVFTAWARRFTDAEAAVTGVWLPAMGVAGARPLAVWVLLSGLPFCALWVRRYGWRPETEPRVKALAPDSDRATFAALAGAQKWSARLGDREDLDGGGRRYEVLCDGIKTVMPNILAKVDNVAGAWHKPATECYAERHPTGITSRGYLTVLGSNSLVAGREWDGRGMDPATGLVRSGRFADGKDCLDKWYEPRYGCYHDLDCGTTGSGKSERLNQKVFTALKTGWFVPVILDPQEGQSLPFWQDKCIYACGGGQVERRVRGLHAAFLDRSSMLGRRRWDNDGVDMPGMAFFDYELLEELLPIVLVILDEAHLVLKDGDKWQRRITADVVEMARLVRKAGGRMVLATQLPGLADLGGSQALRDMLRGGNVWSGRTANAVGQGMLGLVKDPSEIPKYFADGSKTTGLGYADNASGRPDAPMRTDYIGIEHYRNPPPVRQLDDRFLEVMEKAMREAVSPTATVAPVTGGGPAVSPIARPGGVTPPAAVEETDDAPEGRRCVDAVLQVLADSAVPLGRGEVIKWTGDLASMWGRPKPWGMKMVGLALGELLAAGKIEQPAGKGTAYQLRREAGS